VVQAETVERVNRGLLSPDLGLLFLFKGVIFLD